MSWEPPSSPPQPAPTPAKGAPPWLGIVIGAVAVLLVVTVGARLFGDDGGDADEATAGVTLPETGASGTTPVVEFDSTTVPAEVRTGAADEGADGGAGSDDADADPVGDPEGAYADADVAQDPDGERTEGDAAVGTEGADGTGADDGAGASSDADSESDATNPEDDATERNAGSADDTAGSGTAGGDSANAGDGAASGDDAADGDTGDGSATGSDGDEQQGSTAPSDSSANETTTTAPPRPEPRVASEADVAAISVRNIIVSPGKNAESRPLDGSAGGGSSAAFASGTEQVCIFWNVENMPQEIRAGIGWVVNGDRVVSWEQTAGRYLGARDDRPNWCVTNPEGGPLAAGVHRITYVAQGRELFTAEFTIAAD